MKRALALITAVAGLALFWAPSAQAFECGTTLDTFTRANSTNLGTNWTEQAPDPAIEAQGFTVVAAQTGLATFPGVNSNEACVDVATPAAGGVSYAAIVLKYANLANSVFVKVQDQQAGISFDTLYFYKGNNGTTPSGVPTQAIPVPFQSARLHVAVNGATVTVDIDTNFDNQPETTLTGLNFLTDGLGTGIGLGAYGHARLDNFSIPKTQAPVSFSCKGKTATLIGTDGGDIINGTGAADVIVGLGGGDILRGKAGKDVICGGNGKDKLVGGKGKDSLYGDAGKDKLLGGPKNDLCNGGPGRDTVASC